MYLRIATEDNNSTIPMVALGEDQVSKHLPASTSALPGMGPSYILFSLGPSCARSCSCLCGDGNPPLFREVTNKPHSCV